MPFNSPWLKVLTIITWKAVIASAQFVTRPRDVTYQRGATTTGYVECIVAPSITEVYWSLQQDQGIRIITNGGTVFEKLRSKYYIGPQAASTGNYSLTIYNLQRNDTATYQCQISDGGDDQTAKAYLTVADPPGKPEITQQQATLIENQTSTFTCKSSGGFPNPKFSWSRGGTLLQETSHTLAAIAGGESISQLTLMLSSTDNGLTLTCVATNTLMSTQESKTLNVEFSPRITLLPQNAVVLRGSPFDLICNVSANPGYDNPIVWFRNDESMTVQGWQLKETAGITDDTLYQCRASNTRGTSDATARVIVQYAPLVTILDGPIKTVAEGSDIVLSCLVDARPSATVEWRQGGNTIGQSVNYTIGSVLRTHAGVYVCAAKNTPTPNGIPQSATAERNITLNVEYKPGNPSVRYQPSKTSGIFKAGESVSLSCELPDLGNPAASFSWYKLSQPSANLFNGKSFRIANASVGDSDKYYCQARNSRGASSSDPVDLVFQDIPRLISTTPQVTAVNHSISALRIFIQCVYQGFPSPSVTWRKDRTVISDSSQYTIESNVSDAAPYKIVTSNLWFKGSSRDAVLISDMAAYTCEASNAAGPSSTSWSIAVNVLFPPQVSSDRQFASDMGVAAYILCDVLSYPPASSITFLRNGSIVVSDSFVKLENMVLAVDGKSYKQQRKLVFTSVRESDLGSYVCVVESPVGKTEQSMLFMRSRIPDCPSNLSYSQLSWDCVKLTWTPQFDGGHPQEYVIMADNKPLPKMPITISEWRVTDLDPGTAYRFSVTSQNSLGQSSCSGMVTVRTNDLLFPHTEAVFEDDALSVSTNSSEFCVLILGSNDGTRYEKISDECYSINFTRQFDSLRPYSTYKVVTCASGRLDVCSQPSEKVESSLQKNSETTIIIVAVVVSIILLIFMAVIIAIICVLRRRRRQPKETDPKKNGMINPVMIFSDRQASNGTLHSRPVAMSNINNLDMDDPADYASRQETTALPADQNLEYIYAAVHKKSMENINKMNGNSFSGPHDTQSLQNSTLPSGQHYDSGDDAFNAEVPPSPYRANDLSIVLGNHPPYHRFPSLSESGYSTPDSKQLKKIIYEVIV